MHPVITDSQDMLLASFRRPRHRSMAQWAEEEIIVPSGQYAGRRYSSDRQPYSRLWFNEIDSGRWSRHVLTGPSQSGKSLNGFVIPIAYHLFELGETVIAGVPDDDLVKLKWERDIEPVIRRTRYAPLLPDRGAGSRGGKAGAMQFGNGAWLIWLTAGGNDKSRASVTSRVICVTETDGFDKRTSTSAESTKLDQILARAEGYPLSLQRIFLECTVSTEAGYTWRAIKAGSDSQIMLRCPHCRRHVVLEREHFAGWEAADNEVDAWENAAFGCSNCGQLWSEDQRVQANSEALLLHRGQEITPDGNVVGQRPKTTTLGFRWSAVNNLLKPAADVGRQEYLARHDEDEDSAERYMCQFVWAIPPADLSGSLVNLKQEDVVDQVGASGRGQIPDDTQYVTVGIDCNQPVLHYTAIAWSSSGGLIIDYGTTGVPHKMYSIATALRHAIQHLADKLTIGWSGETWAAKRKQKPLYDAVFVDAAWQPDAICAAVKTGDPTLYRIGWRPFQGRGKGQFVNRADASETRGYMQPKRISGKAGIVAIGDHWHEAYDFTRKLKWIKADSNHWKSWLHNRIAIEDNTGAITLFASANDDEHTAFARHITAEKQIIKNNVRVWEKVRNANHWLDSTYLACVAGSRCGAMKKRKPQAARGPIAKESAATFRRPPRPLRTRF